METDNVQNVNTSSFFGGFSDTLQSEIQEGLKTTGKAFIQKRDKRFYP